ncbi:MAG: zf-HC2 domain-containing protein [Actinobacteria bacterium]|nr:MAG: zf-HC2 domain-containing protein [Actinomycetota bacterium]
MHDVPRTAPVRPGGLTCRELVELVTDYLEDALDAGDRARFEAHLDACEGCTAYLSQVRATIWAAGHLCERTTTPTTMDALFETFRDWKPRNA